MQDRFKVRVWNTLVKKFSYFDKPEMQIGTDGFDSGLIFPLSDNSNLYMGKYSEPQFCTGLKDKNCKLIYDGDILKYTSKPTNTQKNNPEYKPFTENYSVVWEDFYTGYNLRSKEKVNCFNLGIMTKDCEIIGNIHETPELLKGNNNG